MPSVTHPCQHTHQYTRREEVLQYHKGKKSRKWSMGSCGGLQSNSCDEVRQLEWDFMVGTAGDRDIHQPSLQHAGKHRSGRLYPVAQPGAHHTLQIQIKSSITHPTADYCLIVGCILWIRPGNIPWVSVLLRDRKRLNRSQLSLISGQLASFFFYIRVYVIVGERK